MAASWPIPNTSVWMPTRPGKGRLDADHRLLEAGLPPVRGRDGRAGGAPARARVHARGAGHHLRRDAAAGLLREDSGRRARRRGAVRLLCRRGDPARAFRVTAMTYGEPTAGMAEARRDAGGASHERLSLGVAARLARYLQVLTQAKKMGKETISSQELSDYTHVNSTQIRRDLSGFGKFGKRGVGYNVEALVTQIRKILRTAGQHNIALIGAGHLGKAIASSEIFADHGFRVVAIFDVDASKVGTEVGNQAVRHIDELRQVVEDEDIVVGVLAVPTHAAQGLANELVDAGVKIIFNYSESLLDVPPEVTVHTSSPAVDLLYALYFYLT